MKNFSEIEPNLKTTKDSLVESFIEKSGLPKELVIKLYEDYELQGIDVQEKFSSLTEGFNIDFNNTLNILLEKIQTTDKDNLNAVILELLDTTGKTNTTVFLKILIYLLYLKDKENFERIADDFNIDDKLTEFVKNHIDLNEEKIRTIKFDSLCESLGINSKSILSKENKVPVILGINDGCDMKSDIQFYNDLKTVLSRNNKRWGVNYHLDNTWDAICSYINKEIEYLTNKDNLYTNDSNFEETLFNQLLNGDLNVMYRDVNVLRTLVSDIQTLNFDCMCLIMLFIKANSNICAFISRKTYNEFINAFHNLYGKISSSRKVSKILVPYEAPNTETPTISNVQTPIENNVGTEANYPSNKIEIFDKLYIDETKYDIYSNISVQAVVDMLYIMKSCSFEFSLQIRPYIREFITKGFELVGKIEHIIYEMGITNKYKNGIM